jgi:hypothetical protein
MITGALDIPFDAPDGFAARADDAPQRGGQHEND